MKKILLTTTLILTLLTPSVMAETVVFNPKTHKMHKLTCPFATRCKTCIKIDKKEAVSKGGKPCKKCGG